MRVAHPAFVDEWQLYPPVIAFWEAKGFQTASQVTDPAGSRWEVDVAAFTPEMDDVRLTEVKRAPSRALVTQCTDRLAMAPRVYAAVPAEHTERMLELTSDGTAQALGVLAVQDDRVELARKAVPAREPREEGRARVLERVLRAALV